MHRPFPYHQFKSVADICLFFSGLFFLFLTEIFAKEASAEPHSGKPTFPVSSKNQIPNLESGHRGITTSFPAKISRQLSEPITDMSACGRRQQIYTWGSDQYGQLGCTHHAGEELVRVPTLAHAAMDKMTAPVVQLALGGGHSVCRTALSVSPCARQ